MLIIGLGGQGLIADLPKSENENKIISYCKAFLIHEGFEIIGACDPDEEKRKLAEKHYGINTYKTLKECKESFDIAVVATPDNHHFPMLRQLAEKNLKLVICEKPICEDLKQAKGIVKLYKTKNIPLMVNYTRRFLPYYQELKKFYDMGLFGEIKQCKLLFNRGWLHTATHGIDLFNWFCGDKTIPTKIEYCGHESGRVWMASILFDKHFWSEERLHQQKVWDYYNFSHWYIVENAYNFLEGKEALKCTADDALKALEICYKLMEGAK